ncbi:MAG: hypothetical protein K6G00_06260 [Treponema sp.]|nr:hypothetical protein [Treponema sp.]
MFLTEFDQEAHDRRRRREGEEIGFKRAKNETVLKALARGLEPTLIAEITGLSIEDINSIADGTYIDKMEEEYLVRL